MSDPFVTPWTIACQTPLGFSLGNSGPWDFSGKNTGVDCHFLLQGIFLSHESKPCLLHWQTDSLLSEPPRKPSIAVRGGNKIAFSVYTFGIPIILTDHSLQFSRSVVSDSLQHHGLKQARLPYPSPTPGGYSNSCPSSWWCHPTSSPSIVPFSCLQSFPASGSFQMTQLFTSGSQSTGASASASVLPMNIWDWFHLGCTGWISLLPKGFSRVLSKNRVQKLQFFCTQLSL